MREAHPAAVAVNGLLQLTFFCLAVDLFFVLLLRSRHSQCGRLLNQGISPDTYIEVIRRRAASGRIGRLDLGITVGRHIRHVETPAPHLTELLDQPIAAALRHIPRRIGQVAKPIPQLPAAVVTVPFKI